MRIVTRAEVEALQKRLQRGTTTYDAANNLHAECYGTIGALAAMVERAQARHLDAEQRLGQIADIAMRRKVPPDDAAGTPS
jgi:broad-specificity NMP kinase